jgi:hypothetical protein
MREIKFSLKGDPEKFPALHQLSMPYHVGSLDKEGDEFLIVSPSADVDLCSMSARERWKFEYQRQRLERRGIKVQTLKGEVGSW